MRNNPKNKLDELLQKEFKNLQAHIVPDSKLNNFKLLHDELNARYKQSGGRCQPIEYGDSRKYKSAFDNSTDISVYVSETFRLHLTLIKEGDIL